MNNTKRPEPEYRSFKHRYLFLLQAIALMFIMNLMLSCKNNNGTSQASQQSADSAAIAKDTLQAQYNAARMQIDQDATKNAALDTMLKQKDAEIATIKGKISRLEKTNKKLLNELKTDKNLIASLKTELNEKSNTYAQQIGLLQNDRDNLLRQRDSLMTQYNKLYALGSVLHASNISLEAVHLKHHGKKEKNTKRARKTDILKVSFDIDENRIAEDGTKKLYLVIKSPSGNLLANAANGSGTVAMGQGSPLSYSVLKEIPLKKNEPVSGITVEWKQDNDYEKGVYSIVIYNGGYRIGHGEVELN